VKFDKIRLVGTTNVDLPILEEAGSSIFVFKGADGLGPPPITVNIARTVLDAGVFQSKKAALRQPIIRIGLNPAWNYGQSPEELRTVLYGLLTPRGGGLVKMQLMYQDQVVAVAQGHISSMEPSIFTKDPEVQVTLECDHPYLLAPEDLRQQAHKTVVGGWTVIDVENPGTAPSGFLINLVLRANVGNQLVFSDHPSGRRVDIVGLNWVANDRFTMDTREGTRGVYRNGALILNNMSLASEWLTTYGGLTQFSINTPAFDWVDYGVLHKPAYWGV